MTTMRSKMRFAMQRTSRDTKKSPSSSFVMTFRSVPSMIFTSLALMITVNRKTYAVERWLGEWHTVQSSCTLFVHYLINQRFQPRGIGTSFVRSTSRLSRSTSKGYVRSTGGRLSISGAFFRSSLVLRGQFDSSVTQRREWLAEGVIYAFALLTTINMESDDHKFIPSPSLDEVR